MNICLRYIYIRTCDLLATICVSYLHDKQTITLLYRNRQVICIRRTMNTGKRLPLLYQRTPLTQTTNGGVVLSWVEDY